MKRMINKSDRYIKVVASGMSYYFVKKMFSNSKSVLETYSHQEDSDKKIIFNLESSEIQEFIDELREDLKHNRKELTDREEEQILYFIYRVSNLKSKI